MMRLWWICNRTMSSSPYEVIFTGAEADGMYGVYISSPSACPEQSKEEEKKKKEEETKGTICSGMGECSYNGDCVNNIWHILC